MIEIKDLKDGNIFWYVNFVSKTYKIPTINKVSDIVKVKILNLDVSNYISVINYDTNETVFFFIKHGISIHNLSNLFYTESEAIEFWNHRLEDFKSICYEWFDTIDYCLQYYQNKVVKSLELLKEIENTNFKNNLIFLSQVSELRKKENIDSIFLGYSVNWRSGSCDYFLRRCFYRCLYFPEIYKIFIKFKEDTEKTFSIIRSSILDSSLDVIKNVNVINFDLKVLDTDKSIKDIYIPTIYDSFTLNKEMLTKNDQEYLSLKELSKNTINDLINNIDNLKKIPK